MSVSIDLEKSSLQMKRKFSTVLKASSSTRSLVLATSNVIAINSLADRMIESRLIAFLETISVTRRVIVAMMMMRTLPFAFDHQKQLADYNQAKMAICKHDAQIVQL